MRVLVTLAICLVSAQPALALDLQSLWNFKDPAASEQRFRAALAKATADEAVILQTQIARSHGLRKDFEQARAVLLQIKPQLAAANAEARTRWALEWGREALTVVNASTQLEAKRWEGSIRHNIGFALHQLGRYDDALAEFQNALAVREKAGNAGSIRVAHWMIAWTLRALKRGEEALAIQLRLERENAAAGTSDIYVFEELELLYRDQGESAKAEHYAALRKAMK